MDDIEVEEDEWFFIDLDGTDCETCGPSYDRLEVSVAMRDGKPAEHGYAVEFSIGCYGGQTIYDATLEGALETLREVEKYGVFGDETYGKQLRGLVADLKGLSAP